MKKLIFASIITVVAGMASCSDPNEGSLFVQPTTIESEMTVTTYLEQQPEKYSMWIDLLKYTDYYNALKDANANATLFAPTNEALGQFLSERELTTVSDLDREYARKLVSNHIIDWGTSSNEVSDSALITLARGGNVLPAQNLFNKYLTLSYGYQITDVDDAQRTDDSHSTDSIFINNQARLGRFSSSTCLNGVVYPMDNVIIPNAENIVERLEGMKGEGNTYQIFADAIKADPEMYRLATLERDTTLGEYGTRVVNTYAYTCFAVPDDVMQRAGISDVQSLKTYLVNNSEGEEVNADSALNHYLKYHFMPTQYTMSEVFKQDEEGEVLIYDTNYKGQAFITELNGSQRIINKDILVVRSDIEASNGLINKVSDVMPVYHPEPVVVKWDFLNSPDIIAQVNGYSTDRKLGNIFTSPLASTFRQIDLSENFYDGQFANITSFTAHITDSKAPQRSYRSVGFMKEQYVSARNQTTPQHGAYMNNYMVLNLGFAGWVEFDTPTIIAGKYKVVLHYIKDPTQSKLFTSGTLTQFNIDSDYQRLAYLYRGLKIMPLYGSTEETLWESVEFDASESHKFKITMRDINAKNESYYHQRLDYVEFIPVQ